MIDVHCHIFNVLDVPAYAFVIDVTIENPLLKALAAPLVALLVLIASFRAPSYRDELSVLTSGRWADAPRNSDSREEQFAGGFQPFIDRYTRYTTDPRQLRVENTESYDRFVDELFRGFGPDVKLGIIGTTVREAALGLAKAIRGYSGGDETLLYIRQFLTDWAPKLSDYRFQLAGLTEDFEGPVNGSVLITPATLDIAHWLPSAQGGPSPTSLADQAELMRLIALKQRPGRLMHGFIAYDPFQQVVDEANGQSNTALSLVRKAVETMGFAGVKLYPPMGFRAIGNSARPDREFPHWMTREFSGLGARLDAALEELYSYCVGEDVPIMAHCAPTQGSTPLAACQADPAFWGDLLDSPKYQNLRVNLGHFGGIWDFEQPMGTWTSRIIRMIASAKYPNLYADLADFSDILGRTSKQITRRAKILQNLVHSIGGNPTVKSQILYGSDWHLLDREPKNSGYPTAMATQMAAAFDPTMLPDLFWRNAARFLGLTRDGQTLARLQQFYLSNGCDPTVLNPFIV